MRAVPVLCALILLCSCREEKKSTFSWDQAEAVLVAHAKERDGRFIRVGTGQLGHWWIVLPCNDGMDANQLLGTIREIYAGLSNVFPSSPGEIHKALDSRPGWIEDETEVSVSNGVELKYDTKVANHKGLLQVTGQIMLADTDHHKYYLMKTDTTGKKEKPKGRRIILLDIIMYINEG